MGQIGKLSSSCCILISLITFHDTELIKCQEIQRNEIFNSYLAKALENDPRVSEKLRDFQISKARIDISKSKQLPSVELKGEQALVRLKNNLTDTNFHAYSSTISVSQLIYDGFLTKFEIENFTQQQIVKYFQLLQEIESTTLNAAEAYLNVLQYRELVGLAEENVKTHVSVFKQIEKGVEAGVARRVDLEQISGRLSLSEANLIAELSNLYDINASFLRITGERPSNKLVMPDLSAISLDLSVKETILQAYKSNPEFNASLYNLDAKQYGLKQSYRKYHPTLSFAASYGIESRDALGNDNLIKEARAGLFLTVKLYDGGSRDASVRIAVSETEKAKDMRDLSCMNLRQKIQMTYNEIENVSSQLPALSAHKLSSDRVKSAYMDQFTIDERSLLDVLDAETEYYESARAYIEASYSQTRSKLSLLSTLGNLTNKLNITKVQLPEVNALTANTLSYSPDHICPAIEASIKNENNNLLLRDTDNDGVTDLWDDCPNSPIDENVDYYGCVN